MELADKIKYLKRINPAWARFDCRFIVDIPAVFEKTPEKITPTQIEYIDKLLYKYRRQWACKDLTKLNERQFKFYVFDGNKVSPSKELLKQ